eukprot:TRINITY_DN649_c0_g1_i1.p2 TRINITY_DN649_c0_g1~~TRINITY_DN649_c0_g1_i1.p2  ORF type:complete len:290 (+),score=137.31 TRINITY_DN649_c0_g1_i1:227-1096(+)
MQSLSRSVARFGRGALLGLQQGVAVPQPAVSVQRRGAIILNDPPRVPHKYTAAEVSEDRDLNALLENNRNWVDGVNEQDPNFFKALGQGQHPKFLYIGCSDARVDPGKLLGLLPGDLFVHRNVGNCCPNDLNFLSVLEYAVRFLKVPHIIVCGHYDCGAVRNAGKHEDIGLLSNWIRQIRDVHRLHDDELSKIDDPEQRCRRLVELNVIEQCRNIFKTACVQRHRLRTHKTGTHPNTEYDFATPRVHAMVFDPADGIIKKIDINFAEENKRLDHIYSLYDASHIPPPTF